MSAELTALQTLATDFNGGIFRLSPDDLAVLFYTSNYLETRRNWIRKSDPYDVVSDSDWDTIEAMVSSALRTIKMPIVGLIMPFVTASPPPNVLPCDGSSYLRVDFPELYAALDTFFIIDADNFSVPDLRGRTVIGVGNGSGLTNRNVGDASGEEIHTLSTAEIPSHGHSDVGHTHSIPLVVGLPAQAGVGFSANQTVPILTANTGIGFANITNTGGDGAHENMQPFYALNYGIVAS